MTQNERLLAHLQAGNTITPLEAMGVFGVYRLAARIEELRLGGHSIDTILRYDANGKQYACYQMRKPLEVGAQVQVKRGYGYGLPKWVRKTAAATVKYVAGDVVSVEFRRGTKVERLHLNVKEVCRA